MNHPPVLHISPFPACAFARHTFLSKLLTLRIAILFFLWSGTISSLHAIEDDVLNARLDSVETMLGQARMFAGTPDSTLLRHIQRDIVRVEGLDSAQTHTYLYQSLQFIRTMPNPVLRMRLFEEVARVAYRHQEYALSAQIAQEALHLSSQNSNADKRDAELMQVLKENQIKTFAVIGLIATLVCSSAGLFVYYMRDRVRTRTERTLRSMNADLVSMNHLLQESNQEVLRQQEVLAEQARNIEIANSELSEKNAEMQSINAHLKVLHDEKNEFLGIAAHDLRNPLTSISLSAERGELLLQNLEKNHHKFPMLLRSIQAESQRMLNIINTLLDVHRIESLGLQVRPKALDAVALLNNLVISYENRAEEKSITLAVHAPHPPVAFMSDEFLLTEVLDNLVSNALKFSPPHTTTDVSVALYDEYIAFSVKDEGPGLTEEDKSKLFQKYSRLSARPTGGEGSIGLGLSIVKRMVDALHGTIHVESTEGNGAMFVVQLPRVWEDIRRN